MIFCPEENSSQNHSCTLKTILSIERFIQQHSGQYSKTELWQQLPKKIMYQSYKVVLAYLLSQRKISLQGKKVVWVGKASTFSLDDFEAQHHACTLTTLTNIHKFLAEHSGQYSKTQAWEKLPKKIMYQSYKVVLAYLIDSGVVHVENRHLVVGGESNE